jgi:hypothetical protein
VAGDLPPAGPSINLISLDPFLAQFFAAPDRRARKIFSAQFRKRFSIDSLASHF